MAGRFLRRPQSFATLTESSILKMPLVRSNQRIAVPLTCGAASNSFKNCHKWMWEDWLPFFCKCEWCFLGVFALTARAVDVSPSLGKSEDFDEFESTSIGFSASSSKFEWEILLINICNWNHECSTYRRWFHCRHWASGSINSVRCTSRCQLPMTSIYCYQYVTNR